MERTLEQLKEIYGQLTGLVLKRGFDVIFVDSEDDENIYAHYLEGRITISRNSWRFAEKGEELTVEIGDFLEFEVLDRPYAESLYGQLD